MPKRKQRAARSVIVLGMILTKKPAKFRHRADRRPKDARRVKETFE